MSQFAFRVSWQDLIRKIGYRYERPVDYVSSLIAKSYVPGAQVDITVDPSTIEVKSDSLTDVLHFDQALKASPLDSTFVIPPVAEYAVVKILSGRRGIVVDAQRAIHRADPDEYFFGTIITILRDQKANKDGERLASEDAEIVARLEYLYWGSDLRVRVNGKSLCSQTYTFSADTTKGAVSYDPTHEGGIRYYTRGRFVEREPFIDGVDVLVHLHPFRTTLTSSHLIKRGDEHLQFQRQLPHILTGYLDSPHILELAKRSPYSCRVLCQTILARFPEDERLRSLADRLAHPTVAQRPSLAHSAVARRPGLAPARQGDSAGRSAPVKEGGSASTPTPAKEGGSTRSLPRSVKVLIPCTLAALCVGVWRHSAVDQPPSGMQTVPESAPSTGGRVPAPSNPKPVRPAPGVAQPPRNGVSSSPPNPKPSVPASVGSPGKSAGPPARSGQNSFAPTGNSINLQTPESTGGTFTRPPWHRTSGPEHGLNYRSTSALAEDLAQMEKEAEKRGSSGEGYVPGITYNVLKMSGGHLAWSDRPPYDTLADGVQRPVWSPELARITDHADGIRAVRSYLSGFLYGAIPPRVGRKYPDDLSAILGVRKVDCVASNTLAAHLLFELGYRKVVAVTGTLGGCSHMWLSVWEDGQWRIEDFTPPYMSPDFARASLKNPVRSPGVPRFQEPADVPGPQRQADPGDSADPNRLTSDTGTRNPSDGATDQLTRVIFFDLCILLALVCVAHSVVSLRLRKRANAAAVVADNGATTAETVRDLLGVAAVKTGSESAYDRRTHTLTLDVADLSADGPFDSAIKAVPLVGRGGAQQQALYRRLADRALR